MFARQAAADFDTQLQDVRPQRLAQFKIARLVGIEQDQRVHVAIARVKDIGHVKAIAAAHLADAAQHEGQRRDGDRAIQAHVVIDLAHRTERRFAAQPDALRFILASAFAELDRVVAQGDGADQGKLFVNLGI